jgi:hypothetical protein
MIKHNPNNLLDVDAAAGLPDDVTATWAAALADPAGMQVPLAPPNKAVEPTGYSLRSHPAAHRWR